MALTEAQKEFLGIYDGYEPIGPPRPGVRFDPETIGTLYADGSFVENLPGQPIRVGNGSVGVGIRL